MRSILHRPSVVAATFVSWLAVAATATPPQLSSQPAVGLRDKTPSFHALIGATVVPSPGQRIDDATIVIRNGRIVSVSADQPAPAGARVWNLDGKFIYAGFIDAYTEESIKWESQQTGAYWNDQIRPELSVGDVYVSSEKQKQRYRKAGITSRLIAPKDGILRGAAALVTTDEAGSNRDVLADNVAQCAALTTSRRFHDGYPNSPMGAVALARQSVLDAQWYQEAWKVANSQPSLPRPEQNRSLAAMKSLIEGNQSLLATTSDERFLLRADRFAREFGLKLLVRGSGSEYRRLEEVAATHRTILLPVNFPKAPYVASVRAAETASLKSLLHWDIAPENPARLADAGVTFAFCSHGLDKPSEWLPAIRKAVRRGLSRETALAAITTIPARLFQVDDQLGRIGDGMQADLVVTDNPLFDDECHLTSCWVRGNRFPIAEEPDLDVRGDWDLEATVDGRTVKFRVAISGDAGKPKGKLVIPDEESNEDHKATNKESPDNDTDVKASDATEPEEDGDEDSDQQDDVDRNLKHLSIADAHLSASFDGQSIELQDIVQISGAILVEDRDREEPKLSLTGQLRTSDGSLHALTGIRTDSDSEKSQDADESAKNDNAASNGDADDRTMTESDDGQEDDNLDSETDDDKEAKPSLYAVNYPLGALGMEVGPAQRTVALVGATVWTCDEQGVLQDAIVLVKDGQISGVGSKLDIPAGTERIDASGLHITPGIIDCHSHMATDGGINESGQAITAEVRIGDFINPNDITIYRQLAGGVTCANILHGSANPIGGQNQVIKLRWGDTGESMKLRGAPAGIKFALGENVKQSNWGEKHTTRYPQTRMGVPELMRDAFTAAIEYRRAHETYRETRSGLPPRIDLELEAVAEILERKRWIHCHSYRQDEIVTLLGLLDQHQVTIGTLQHILEGYKVTDVMKKHGAMGSSFADWWAYKIEVYDAIPYNGALMHRDGIVVSFNSDDAELGRHLNQEAAKAMKYGGVSAEEALKFVTLNPAKQLRIDNRVGSITKGKDADLAIWNGPPLSTLTRCEQTWVDGRRYFDRNTDQELRERDSKMRAALVQRILQQKASMNSPDALSNDTDDLWPREDVFCGHHGHDHGE